MSGSQSLAAYCIILGTAILGLVGAAWWVLAAPVLLLTAVNHDEHLRLARRFSRVGERRVMLMAIGLSALNGFVFAGLSFALGRMIGWIFNH